MSLILRNRGTVHLSTSGVKWTSGGAERQDEHWLGTAEELDAITPAHDALLNKTALEMTAALEIGPVADQLEG